MINSTTGEEFITPEKGGVSKDIARLTDRSLVDLGVIEDKLNVGHLEKDTQDRVREIEENRKDGFARKGKKLAILLAFSMICLFNWANQF